MQAGRKILMGSFCFLRYCTTVTEKNIIFFSFFLMKIYFFSHKNILTNLVNIEVCFFRSLLLKTWINFFFFSSIHPDRDKLFTRPCISADLHIGFWMRARCWHSCWSEGSAMPLTCHPSLPCCSRASKRFSFLYRLHSVIIQR